MQHAASSEICLLCHSSDQKEITTSYSFNVPILECSHCGFVHCGHVPDSVLDDYYKKELYRGRLPDGTLVNLKKNSVAQAVSQLIYLNSVIGDQPFGNALDFGAADGALAEILLVKSKTVYVSEVDPQYIAILKNNPRLIFLDGRVLDLPRYKNFFNFISLSHVLEHLPDPLSALERFAGLLAPDSYLFIDLPNEIELLKKTSFQGKGHLSFFSMGSIKNLVEINGKFRIVDIRACNRSVQAFIDSGLKLGEEYFRQETENGTTIRMLLQKC